MKSPHISPRRFRVALTICTTAFCGGALTAEAACSATPCLTPSPNQASELFNRIESIYPQLFSSGTATQSQIIGNDLAYFRNYDRSAATGLGAYQGGLWYSIGNIWTRYSSLDTGNSEFCGGSCWGTRRYKGEVWADNWFALYIDDKLVAEDSVPITTERSFNAESFFFNATFPFDINLIIKDYKQDDSGLEYIGTSRQQIGDGGFIMQITDTTTGKVVAVSSSTMKCKVIHRAPLNPSCEKSSKPALDCLSTIEAEPTGWKLAGFDTSSWESATIYTPEQVGVKEGYFSINWSTAAKLIWTSDLRLDNTLLCKLTGINGN